MTIYGNIYYHVCGNIYGLIYMVVNNIYDSRYGHMYITIYGNTYGSRYGHMYITIYGILPYMVVDMVICILPYMVIYIW